MSIEAVSSQFPANRSAENIINGNGFTEESGVHSSAGGDGISWTSAATTADPLDHFITFDLGKNHDLDSVKIWNWNTFATWIANPAYGLSPAERGFNLDPDGDGLANGVEAWLGTNPGESNAGFKMV